MHAHIRTYTLQPYAHTRTHYNDLHLSDIWRVVREPVDSSRHATLAQVDKPNPIQHGGLLVICAKFVIKFVVICRHLPSMN